MTARFITEIISALERVLVGARKRAFLNEKPVSKTSLAQLYTVLYDFQRRNQTGWPPPHPEPPEDRHVGTTSPE